jgi:hypothetical protein
MAPELLTSSTTKGAQAIASGSPAPKHNGASSAASSPLTGKASPAKVASAFAAVSQSPGPASEATGAAASQGGVQPVAAAATSSSRAPSGSAIQWAKGVWHSLKKSSSSQSLSAAAGAAGGMSGAQRAAGADKLSMTRGCSSIAGRSGELAPGAGVSAASHASIPLMSTGMAGGASANPTTVPHASTVLSHAPSSGLPGDHPEPSFAVRQDDTPALSYSTTQAQGAAAEDSSVYGAQGAASQGPGQAGAAKEEAHPPQVLAQGQTSQPHVGLGAPAVTINSIPSAATQQEQRTPSMAAPAAAALDVWSLGVTTYQCLVGRRPYSSDTGEPGRHASATSGKRSWR